MTISKGDYSICITRFEQLEKRQSLYVMYKNRMLKVGSFSSEEKAEIFCDWLAYMVGLAKKSADGEWMK